MAFRVRKTEHTGPKKGHGFWGRKAEAKHQSSRVRRRLAVAEINEDSADNYGPSEESHEKAIQEQDS
jgi:hypothetical protein